METETVLDTRQEEKIDVTEPNMWKVIMHDDNKTTMEFVVMLLVQVFHKNPEEATEIMVAVHTNGKATVGVYTYEIAEEKQNTGTRTARAYGYPLKLTLEEDK